MRERGIRGSRDCSFPSMKEVIFLWRGKFEKFGFKTVGFLLQRSDVILPSSSPQEGIMLVQGLRFECLCKLTKYDSAEQAYRSRYQLTREFQWVTAFGTSAAKKGIALKAQFPCTISRRCLSTLLVNYLLVYLAGYSHSQLWQKKALRNSLSRQIQ